jgi:replication factor C small subunit
MADVSVWTEKYRPKTLSDVVNQKYVVDRLKAFVKERNIPHMLFAGPAGCGKTTAALAIAHELYGDSLRGNMLMLNASDERGIDVIRGEVKRFASTISVSNVPFKLIFLDESDALTPEAQQALRRTMEMFSNKTRFILAANYSSRIIEPIQSRCAVFRFSSLKDLDVMEYLDRIIDGEKLKIEDNAKLTVAKLSEVISEGDKHPAASAVLGKKITEDLVYEVAAQADPKEIRKMVEHALAGKFVEARDLLKEILLKRECLART